MTRIKIPQLAYEEQMSRLKFLLIGKLNFRLPQEYWHDDILFSIANAVGRPVAIDRKTKASFYGHFSRVCVDVDETHPRVSEVLVEREQPGSAELFEDPPSRCGDCKKYGHRSKNCPTRHQVTRVEAAIPGVEYVDARVGRRSRRASSGASVRGTAVQGVVTSQQPEVQICPTTETLVVHQIEGFDGLHKEGFGASNTGVACQGGTGSLVQKVLRSSTSAAMVVHQGTGGIV
ncbi:uncharacterized protein LOC122659180 [Telopea speciosissima]|uniref:uncharacterized protein LOC122659180 n=1 Tax=Telopea speciosissima TaxID=54955 RepID=UPI001CC646A5|nr:uncharacterized protein LOC122659180 [Telopea speciosissima]